MLVVCNSFGATLAQAKEGAELESATEAIGIELASHS
jgi:hypothetical protein